MSLEQIAQRRVAQGLALLSSAELANCWASSEDAVVAELAARLRRELAEVERLAVENRRLRQAFDQLQRPAEQRLAETGELRGLLCVDGWAGRREIPCRVVGATPSKWRIVVDTAVSLSRSRTLEPGQPGLVPRSAVRMPDTEAGA